jgi:hypothetical protein
VAESVDATTDAPRVGRWFSEPSRCNRVRRRGGRTTDSFILIEEATGLTVGAWMINGGN